MPLHLHQNLHPHPGSKMNSLRQSYKVQQKTAEDIISLKINYYVQENDVYRHLSPGEGCWICVDTSLWTLVMVAKLSLRLYLIPKLL